MEPDKVTELYTKYLSTIMASQYDKDNFDDLIKQLIDQSLADLEKMQSSHEDYDNEDLSTWSSEDLSTWSGKEESYDVDLSGMLNEESYIDTQETSILNRLDSLLYKIDEFLNVFSDSEPMKQNKVFVKAVQKSVFNGYSLTPACIEKLNAINKLI